MKSKPCKFKKALTLIEVLGSMLCILIIVIGVMSYMYSCAANARAADVRITAARVGQMLLDAWKSHISIADGKPVWIVDDFNPLDESFMANFPASVTTTTVGETGVGTELPNRYLITIDGANFFATLSYREDGTDFYLLNACMVWNRNNSSSALEDNYRSIWISGYSIY